MFLRMAGYKKILDDFENEGKVGAQFMGLTASPERRTGDQRDQLSWLSMPS